MSDRLTTLLTRDTLLAATEVPTEHVPVPELGADTYVLVRGMTGAERDEFEASCIQGRGRRREFNMQNVRAKLVAFCCMDPSGARMFSPDDVTALSAIRADILDRIFGVAQRLSGIGEEDLEELGKPSPSPTASATSSSPSPSS